jgi:3-hydroxyisobutyrate dehydrogenase-like beta-hydroxyacid dehydrogenase
MIFTRGGGHPVLKVGFIGLGDMGGAIAHRIIGAGFPTALWARREATLQQFPPGSFTRCADPAEVGQHSDVVGVCVFGDADVRQIILEGDGLLQGLKPGGTILIHSTVSAEVCSEVAIEAARRGCAVLDAPVSGGRDGALRGKLAIMLGGEAAALARIRPVLASYGAVIRLMGPVGSGQKMKVLNNILSFANGRLAIIAIETGQRLGLDPEAVLEVLRSGGAGSASIDSIADRLLPDPPFQRHAVTMVVKDTALFTGIRAEAGLAPTLLEQLAQERSQQIVPDMNARGR